MKRIGENAGFVKLYRELAGSEFWLKERFTKAQAWIDLLMLAQGVSNTDWSEGKLKNFEAGTVYMPIEQLAERWKWNRRTVAHYLKYLAEKGMATTISQKMVGTQIKIENWSVYQGKQESALHMGMHMERSSAAHEGVHMDDDSSKTVQNKGFEDDSFDEPSWVLPKAPLESADSETTPNKERIKNNKEYIMCTSGANSPPPPTPLLKRGGGDGSSVKTKADIPEMWRNDFETYEDYWRWRNQ